MDDEHTLQIITEVPRSNNDYRKKRDVGEKSSHSPPILVTPRRKYAGPVTAFRTMHDETEQREVMDGVDGTFVKTMDDDEMPKKDATKRRSSVVSARRSSIISKRRTSVAQRRTSIITTNSESKAGRSTSGNIENDSDSDKDKSPRQRRSSSISSSVDSLEEIQRMYSSTFQKNRGIADRISKAMSSRNNSTVSNRFSVTMNMNFENMLYGNGKIATQQIELMRSRERSELLKNQCEMRRLYQVGHYRKYKNAIKNSPLRKQVDLLVRNDRYKMAFNGKEDVAQTNVQTSKGNGNDVSSRRGSVSAASLSSVSAAKNPITSRNTRRRQSFYRAALEQEEDIKASVLLSQIKRSMQLQNEAHSPNSLRKLSAVAGAEAIGSSALAAARQQLQSVSICPTPSSRETFRNAITMLHTDRYYHNDVNDDEDAYERCTDYGETLRSSKRSHLWSLAAVNSSRGILEDGNDKRISGRRLRDEVQLEHILDKCNDVIESLTSEKNREKERSLLKMKLAVFIPNLTSIYEHYISRKNVYYKQDDDFNDGLNEAPLYENQKGKEVESETLVLFQFWQYVKECHLLGEKFTIACINRLMNSVLHDFDESLGSAYIHNPLRGPISFIDFVDATIRIVAHKQQHMQTPQNSTQAGKESESSLETPLSTKERRQSLSSSFAHCMESLILSNSCGQKRSSFYNRYYDNLVQTKLQKESGFINHLYTYFRDSLETRNALNKKKEGNAANLKNVENGKAETSKVVENDDDENTIKSKRSDEPDQNILMTVAVVEDFVESFDLYQGNLTHDRLRHIIAETVGFQFTNKDPTKADDADCHIIHDSDEILVEEFSELLCRMSLCLIPRFKSIVSPLHVTLDKLLEKLKRVSSVKFTYHMENFSKNIKEDFREANIHAAMEIAQSRQSERIEKKFGRVKNSIMRSSMILQTTLKSFSKGVKEEENSPTLSIGITSKVMKHFKDIGSQDLNRPNMRRKMSRITL